MSAPQLHKTQASILHSLRYAESERFNSLMRPTDQTSDTFKFHLRKLVKLGYVTKLENGQYQLTAAGKEYANNLNEALRRTEKQPKVSVLLIVDKLSADGRILYLAQRRSRNPHYGYWSEIHGRAVWGESFEDTAKRQLKRQTSLDAHFTVHSFRRIRDYSSVNKQLLEDKLFVIVRASNISGELTNTYSGGTNAWMTLEELRSQEKVFASTLAIIDELALGPIYTAQDLTYSEEDY